MNEDRNLFVALFLCLLILVAWPHFFPPRGSEGGTSPDSSPSGGKFPSVASAVSSEASKSRSSSGPRTAPRPVPPAVRIETEKLAGSLSLEGLRFDDLTFLGYRARIGPHSPLVRLFLPPGVNPGDLDPDGRRILDSTQDRPGPYFGQFGWLLDDQDASGLEVPGPNTVWSIDVRKANLDGKGTAPASAGSFGAVLGPDRPANFVWDNGAGLVFRRRICVDREYLFTIEDSVTNTSDRVHHVSPYGFILRRAQPDDGSHVLHEGLVGVSKSKGLKELGYSGARKDPFSVQDTEGWVGVTDKYWASALIPEQGRPVLMKLGPVHGGQFGGDMVEAGYKASSLRLDPGKTVVYTHRLFSGPKVVSLIKGYQDALGICRFDSIIDWGWFSFLTKPVFYVLYAIDRVVGNFGVAILIMTVLVKLVFYPLACKSHVSMSKMRLLAPRVEQIRKEYENDVSKQQRAIMALYQKEGVNPLSGCLPLLVQIPVFFALYKVLYGTIEMRHAPFFGWIHDLSAPDPTSLLNLFGLFHWSLPTYLNVGVWPTLMGLSMFVQQSLTPGTNDPVQKRIFLFLPIVFTFMLAQFPAGLVIYWTWNNSLSIVQQLFIMRGRGAAGGGGAAPRALLCSSPGRKKRP